MRTDTTLADGNTILADGSNNTLADGNTTLADDTRTAHGRSD